jgi:serine/threonine protein kinase
VAEEQLTVGNFELHNCIATGNTTQIWEVSEQGAPMQLAMKLLLDDAHKEAAEKTVLKHEFKVGSSLEHPGFLRFHQLEVNRDHGFFTMDFVRSPSLKQHMSSSLPGIQSSFQKMAESLCRAFQFMHDQGWLHCDIKPDNILVNKAGESKVIDFSLSSRMKSRFGKFLAGKQIIQGTRNYIAPETILKKPADQKTDQYSLGVTFFELVTGNLPFAGSTPNDLLKKHVGEMPAPPSAINPNITVELENVILKMLEKKPVNRFDSMQGVGAAIRGLKCFIEDPLELYERMVRKDKEEQTMSIDKRLDSRADADRTSKGIATPVAKKKKKKPTAAMLLEEEKRKEKQEIQQPAPAEPAAPMMQPMMQPMQYPTPGYQMPGMMPGQPMPGYQMPMAGQPYPGQPYPDQPMPGQYYPGQPMPGQMPPGPLMPGQPYPGQPMPQQPYPVQQPMPPVAGQQPVPTQPAAPPIPAPQQNTPPTPVQPAPIAPEPPTDPDAPQDATEDDVRGLMDMIE